MSNKIRECPFCNMDKTKLENTILDETRYFYITPSLGSLTEGYVLITSKRHINSMSELNVEEIDEYKILIRKYRNIFKNIYKKYPIIFEHGTPDLKDKIKANSVIHAHTHIVNHNYKNENELIKKLKFKMINKIENMHSNRNYIFYVSSNNVAYITNEFEPVSQFMRIEIAKDVKLIDKYDWRKNDFADNIILTISSINDYFNNQTNKGSEKMNEEKSFPKVAINWYPGHMAKTKRLIKENIDKIDIVYEVVDARIPYSTRVRELDDSIINKPRIVIFTKMDLCDKLETNKWVKHYEKNGDTVMPLDLEHNPNLKPLFTKTKELMEEKNQKLIAKGMKVRKPRVLIIGVPNAGKSTLINRLVGRKAVNVGNKPGVTKDLNWIRINDEIELLDTPGILWPKLSQDVVAYNLACFTAIREEILPIYEVIEYFLRNLEKYYPEKLKSRYGVDNVSEDIIDTLDIIGKRRGCLIKGGEIDYDKVIQIIMSDIKDGLISNITFDRYEELV